MHKVHHHGHGFAVNFLFAGAVEVKLQQIVGDAINAQLATRRHDHLDSVAVVEYLERAFFVVGRHHHAGFHKGVFDVQGRLRFASGAGGELFAPLVRAHFALIAPMGCGVLFLFLVAVAVIFTLGLTVFAMVMAIVFAMAVFFLLVALGFF